MALIKSNLKGGGAPDLEVIVICSGTSPVAINMFQNQDLIEMYSKLTLVSIGTGEARYDTTGGGAWAGGTTLTAGQTATINTRSLSLMASGSAVGARFKLHN